MEIYQCMDIKSNYICQVEESYQNTKGIRKEILRKEKQAGHPIQVPPALHMVKWPREVRAQRVSGKYTNWTQPV